MRLCAALSVVLVASLVLAFEVMRRPRHHAPLSTNLSEDAEVPRAPFRPTLRAPSRSPRPAPSRPPPGAPVRSFSPPAPEHERSATIAGRLRVPDDAGPIHVVVTPSDGTDAAATGFAGEDAFRIQRLVSGRPYNVQLSGSGVRTVRLIGVVAPAIDLDVTLEARLVIHVAVGFPRGERCPIEALAVRTNRDGADPEVTEAGDRPDCRFELTGPNEAGPVTVEAGGRGEVYIASVDIPAHGDPEPVCLNPPCRANPLEGQAQLRVVLDGVDARSRISAHIVPVDDANRLYSCASSHFTCSIETLSAGLTYAITVSGRDCHGGPVTVTMTEGANQVSVPCRPGPPAIETASDSNDDIEIAPIEITSDSSDEMDS